MASETNDIDELETAFDQLLYDIHDEDDEWLHEQLNNGNINVYSPDEQQVLVLAQSVANELNEAAFSDVRFSLIPFPSQTKIVGIREAGEGSTVDLAERLYETFRYRTFDTDGIDVQRDGERLIIETDNQGFSDQAVGALDSICQTWGDRHGEMARYEVDITEHDDGAETLTIHDLRIDE